MNKFSAAIVATAISVCTVAILSSPAFADPGMPPPPPAGGPMPPPGHQASPEMFQKMKARMLDNQQKRIQILQQASGCIQAATAMDQLRDCHEKEHQALMQMQDQMKQQRKQDH